MKRARSESKDGMRTPRKRSRIETEPSVNLEGTTEATTVEQYLHAQVDILEKEIMETAEAECRKIEAELQGLTSKEPATSEEKAKTGKETIYFAVIAGPYKGGDFSFCPGKRKTPVLVGRSKGAKFSRWGISLPDDEEVSTAHGKILRQETSICYADTDSSNGSFVNGERCTAGQPYPLKEGDTLRIGETELKVEKIE